MATTLDLKSKEEKDAELDKRIEALRRKNEALIRRYQEIEEDRKKAELEGVAVTAPRKSRSMEKENMAVEEKNLGPSRRTPGTPRPPGASRGGRTHPQQGGRAGVGRASRGWEDGAGEQLRGGTGGRGRRGRGRGSPHLLGAGDNSTSDRKSKVGTKQTMKLGSRFSVPCFLLNACFHSKCIHSFIFFLVLGLKVGPWAG